MHWKQLPVAIPQDANEYVFTGSVVYDKANTSGLGTQANPPLVAVYTSAQKATGIQEQDLAYSLDGGLTWTKYAGNPVININSQNFRDPKVFWYAPGREWMMVVARSDVQQVQFYSSPDLKHWTHLSDFGPAGATGGVWECPDLYQIAVDGNPRHTKWVLVVNINPGSYAGGSGTQYWRVLEKGLTKGTSPAPHLTPPAWTAQATPDARIVVPLRISGFTHIVTLQRGNLAGGPIWSSVHSGLSGFIKMRGEGQHGERDIPIVAGGQSELRVEDGIPIDPAALKHASSGPPVYRWTGVQTGDLRLPGLEIWLARLGGLTRLINRRPGHGLAPAIAIAGIPM